MEGVTLLESGTTRVHFALVKRLEDAESAQRADEVVLEAVQSAKEALASGRTATLNQSTIASQLLVVLHSLQIYPHAASSSSLPRQSASLQIDFTLIPALHLLATSKNARGIQIAYSVLIELLRHPSSHGQSNAATSLLLLNTMRQHLGYGAQHSRPNPRTSEGSNSEAATAALDYARKHLALRTIVAGTPAGPHVVPALYGPVSALLTSRDATIQSLAVEAVLTLSAYRHEEDDRGVARATWEQVRQVVLVSTRKNGKEKAQDGQGPRVESLRRAFITAAGIAFMQNILTAEEYIEDALSMAAKDEASVWLVLRILRSLSDVMRVDAQDLKPETTDRIAEWSMRMFASHGKSYPFLVEAARLAGLFASVRATHAQTAFVHETWTTGKAHLHAANANRKVVALAVLEALLSFNWPAPSSPEDLQLDETEMAALMGMLSDGDGSIRVRALSLFARIDGGILQGHLEALQAALQADGIKDAQRVVLRACEVLCVQCQGKDLAKSYAVQLAVLLRSTAMQDALANDVVERVVADWVACGATLAALHALVVGLQGGQQLSPTAVLLLATLVCECLDPGGSNDDALKATLLTNSSVLLPLAGEANIALQEALMIALIKLAALCEPGDVRAAMPVLVKYAESTPASLVKERVRQLSTLSHDDRTADLRVRFGRASLLSTLDAVDAIMAAPSHGSFSATHAGADAMATPDRQAPRPLQYEAYAAPTSADSTAFVSADLI